MLVYSINKTDCRIFLINIYRTLFCLNFHLNWISFSRNIADHKATTPLSWCVGITAMHQESIVDLHMTISKKHLDILKCNHILNWIRIKILSFNVFYYLSMYIALYYLHHNIKGKKRNLCKCKLTDICPAKRGQSKAFSFSTSSSGISWLTLNMLPESSAWWWGKRPEQWLPVRKWAKPTIHTYSRVIFIWQLVHQHYVWPDWKELPFFMACRSYKNIIKGTFLHWLR